MRSIRRIVEGRPLPENVSIEKVLGFEEETQFMPRVITVVVKDERFWLSDEEKRRAPLRGFLGMTEGIGLSSSSSLRLVGSPIWRR